MRLALQGRVLLIGRGGIGSQLAKPLVRYLASRPPPQPVPILVDGDRFELSNFTREACAAGDLGANKAAVLAGLARAVGLPVQVVPSHVTADNVGHLVRAGDVVLLAVDNHADRALLGSRLGPSLIGIRQHDVSNRRQEIVVRRDERP